MVLKKTILLYLILLPLFIFSQGYRGKRFSVSYVPGGSFVLQEAVGVSKYPLMHNKLEFGYCASKRILISISAEMVKGNFSNHYWYDTYQFNDQLVSLKAIHFFKRHASFAPIGTYWGYSFGFGKQNDIRVITTDNPNSQDSQYDIKNYFIDGSKRTNLYLFSGYFGYNYLVKEHFLIGIGSQYGLENNFSQPLRHMAKLYLNLGFIF